MTFLSSKAVFLDRDGVINHKAPEKDYIRTWHEIRFIPGAIEAVASLNRAGYKVFVATNQRGVATLRIKMEDLLDIHHRIQQEFASSGAIISQIYYCPHDTFAKCSCRKPQPGMLQRAALEHGLNLRASWMIGDSQTDVRAGESAGCRSILLASRVPYPSQFSSLPLIAESLELAVPLILELSDVETKCEPTQQLELSRSPLREDA
jgi:D-glycero-D-manno-heptose 1,7-bisphosphate phosphatase